MVQRRRAGAQQEGVLRFRSWLWPLSHLGLTGLGGRVTKGRAAGGTQPPSGYLKALSEVKLAATGGKTCQLRWACVHHAATANLDATQTLRLTTAPLKEQRGECGENATAAPTRCMKSNPTLQVDKLNLPVSTIKMNQLISSDVHKSRKWGENKLRNQAGCNHLATCVVFLVNLSVLLSSFYIHLNNHMPECHSSNYVFNTF